MRHIIWDLALISVGVALLVKPHLIYRLTKGWKRDDAEKPSKLYRMLCPWGAWFVGVIFILVGIASLIHRFRPR